MDCAISLLERSIVDAKTGAGEGSGDFQDPLTNAVGNREILSVSDNFIGIEKGLADQAGPYRDGFEFILPAPSTGEIKHFSPTVLIETRSPILH